MTIARRLVSISDQADSHRREADDLLDKVELKRREKAPRAIIQTLMDQYYRHRAISDDLAWAVEVLKEIVTPAETQMADNKLNSSDHAPGPKSECIPAIEDEVEAFDEALPREMPERKRLQDYVLRYLWDGVAKNSEWLRRLILERTTEDMARDEITRLLNYLDKKKKAIEKVPERGRGYYRIRAEYAATHECP